MKNIEKNDEVSKENARQYVTFLIGNETYGVAVDKVKEIIGMTGITYVPNTAYFMEGVINLRGSVVPVVDMRKKFNMEIRQYDNYSVIIIVEVKSCMVGMIVDSVADVLSISLSTIQSTPNFTAKIESDFITGIGRIEDNLVIILDVDLILSDGELQSMETGEPAVEDKVL